MTAKSPITNHRSNDKGNANATDRNQIRRRGPPCVCIIQFAHALPADIRWRAFSIFGEYHDD